MIKAKPLIQWLLIVAAVFPLLVLIRFIDRYGVNVPFGDQWDLVYLFRDVTLGNANFQTFFAQHNEHRMVFPNLIFTALAFATHWDIHYELYFSVGLALASFGLIHQIAADQTEKKDWQFWLVNLFVSIVIFSLVQVENWLWGFQIAWFLITLCLVSCLFCLTCKLRSPWLNVGLAAFSCLIASFSSAHGLLTWLAAIPSLFILANHSGQPSQRNKILLVWAALFLTSCAIYLHGYHKPSISPDVYFWLKHPKIAIASFFSILGFLLLPLAKAAWISGLIVFINFLVFLVRYLRSLDSTFAQQAAPWISMGLFSILFAFLTMIGRSGFGVMMAFSSRYTTVSLLLIIALIQLWRLAFAGVAGRSWRGLAMGGIFAALVLIASIQQSPVAQSWRTDRQLAQACLEMIPSVDAGLDSCFQRLVYDPVKMRQLTTTLNQIGLRQDPQRLDFATEPSKRYGYLDSPNAAGQTLLIKKICLNCVQEIRLAGWAVLPDERKAASLVLLSRSGPQSQDIILDAVAVQLPSPDVAAALQTPQYAKARWSSPVSIQALPLGETVFKAWVYDRSAKRLIQLGEMKVTVAA